jgi:hypothetical protein
MLRSNPTRDSQARAGEWPAGPGIFVPGLFSFFCPAIPQKTYPYHALTARFPGGRVWLVLNQSDPSGESAGFSPLPFPRSR